MTQLFVCSHEYSYFDSEGALRCASCLLEMAPPGHTTGPIQPWPHVHAYMWQSADTTGYEPPLGTPCTGCGEPYLGLFKC